MLLGGFMKAILFFSDFNNTMTASPFLSEGEYQKEIGFLVEKLDQIREFYDGEKMVISFSTSYQVSEYERIKKLVRLLFDQANDKGIDLQLSKIFMNDGELSFDNNYKEYQIKTLVTGDRLVQLANHIKQLRERDVEVVWAGYADDGYPVNENGEERLKRLGVNVFFNGFMPTVWGANVLDENVFVSRKPSIMGLNEAIDNFVLENKCRRK